MHIKVAPPIKRQIRSALRIPVKNAKGLVVPAALPVKPGVRSVVRAVTGQEKAVPVENTARKRVIIRNVRASPVPLKNRVAINPPVAIAPNAASTQRRRIVSVIPVRVALSVKRARSVSVLRIEVGAT